MKTALSWVARILLWPIVGALLLFASVWVHVPTAMGRAAAEDGINHLASDSIPGRLHVDSVDELDLGHAAVSGFAAFDLDDVEVLSVAHGSMRIDLWALVADGVIRIRDMQGYEGSVVVRPGRHHKVSIKDVFSKGRDPGKRGFDLDLGWMWAENIRLAIRMVDRPLTFQIATASASITRRGDAPVAIDLRDVSATMVEPAPLGVDIRMVGAGGRIRPKTDEVVNLDTGVCLGDEALQARIIFRPGPPKVARVIIDYESGLGFLASLGLRIGDLISEPLEVDERELAGDPPDCEGPSPRPTASSGSGSGEGPGAASGPTHPAAGPDGEVSEEELEDWNDRIDERLEDADEQAEEALERVE